jgi:hypothetical protein
VEYIVGYLANCWLRSGGVMIAFWLQAGCLLFEVAVLITRMLRAVEYAVEYIVEYVVEHVVRYVAS